MTWGGSLTRHRTRFGGSTEKGPAMAQQQQLWKDSLPILMLPLFWFALVCFVFLSVQAVLRVTMEIIFVFREMICIKVSLGLLAFVIVGRGSCYTNEAGLKCGILLAQPPES